MPKTVDKWFLFQYIGLELTPVSKPFKTLITPEVCGRMVGNPETILKVTD